MIISGKVKKGIIEDIF